MPLIEDVLKGWFGKRRPTVRSEAPQYGTGFVVPPPERDAHSPEPTGGGVPPPVEPMSDVWAEMKPHARRTSTTVDPLYQVRREEDDEVYTTAPQAQMNTLKLAPDARWSPVPVSRPTGTQSNYRAEAPFDQGMSRRFTGEHFSMASNKRMYPIGGMVPSSSSRRNTYRLDPLPTDLYVVDQSTESNVVRRDTVYDDTTLSGTPTSRSYRLD